MAKHSGRSVRRRRPVVDITNNNRASPRELSATLNAPRSTSSAKRQSTRSDEKVDALWQDIDHAPAAGGARRRYLGPEPVDAS